MFAYVNVETQVTFLVNSFKIDGFFLLQVPQEHESVVRVKNKSVLVIFAFYFINQHSFHVERPGAGVEWLTPAPGSILSRGAFFCDL